MTSPDSRHDDLVEALLAAALGGAMPAGESAGTTEEQALLAARWQQARALVSLRRRTAPPTLDGFVVAALQAGLRETRAVDALRDLAAHRPHAAPVALDERVAVSIDRLRAPGALDACVAERLAQPGAGIAQSFLGRLPRLAAPDGLAARLATRGASGTAGLEFVAPRGRGARGRFGPFRLVHVAALFACAALLVVGLSGRFGAGRSGDDDAVGRSDWSQPIVVRSPSQRSVEGLAPVRSRLNLTFDFVEHESIRTAQLSPEQRSLVSGLVGEPMEGGS
jgi:hypothetical protein